MSDAAKLVCLVTPGHLTSTPRLLKEADTLHAAGYRVHVVHASHYAPNVAADAEIAAGAAWESTAVPAFRGPGVFLRKIARRAAQRLVRLAPFASDGIAARAQNAESHHLAAVAAALDAHYYIGHCLGGIAAAALAAERTRAKFGFDLEDLHDEETAAAAADPLHRTIVRLLQATLLPRASHLTAAAPLIAAEYERRYQVAPTSVLNVFPLAEAPAVPVDPGPISAGRPAILYWFSQTIGPGRGLEEVVTMMSHLRTPAQLHLRGHVTGDYVHALNAHAAQCRLRQPIVYSPFSSSGEMVRLAADADLGLSTEQHEPFNREICLTNKVFVYVLAGVPQLLSDTRAHLALAPDLGPSALVGDFADPVSVARQVDDFLSDPARIAAARTAAWRLGRERYNWDVEQKTFLRVAKKAIGKP